MGSSGAAPRRGGGARLARSVFLHAAHRCVPLSVQLDLTARCNESCVHCYRVVERRQELRTAEVLELLGQLAQAGTLFLTLSGGEPLLRHDLLAVVARARELHFDVRIKTNATLVTPSLARALGALAVREVAVSVYSHRPEAHDAVTGRSGSLFRTVAGLRLLGLAGVRVRVVAPVMRATADDLHGLRVLAARLGAALTVDPLITVRNDGARKPLAFRLSREGVRRVLADCGLAGTQPDAAERAGRSDFPCGAGHNSCYVSPYGDVTPCVQLPLVCGNVREAPFALIWHESAALARLRSLREGDLRACSACVLRSFCRRCPGLALLEDGDLLGPSTAACTEAHVRAEMSGWGALAQGSAPPVDDAELLEGGGRRAGGSFTAFAALTGLAPREGATSGKRAARADGAGGAQVE